MSPPTNYVSGRRLWPQKRKTQPRPQALALPRVKPSITSSHSATGEQVSLAAGQVARLQQRLEAAECAVAGHAAELEVALTERTAEAQQLQQRLQQLTDDATSARQVR